jgi:hypothetical protein
MPTPEELNGPDPLLVMMDKCGLSEQALIDELAAKIKATEVKVFKGTVTAKDEDSGMYVTESEIIYSKPLGALGVQLQALDMALKLRQMYPKERLDVHHSGNVAFSQFLDEIDGSSRGLPSSRRSQGDSPDAVRPDEHDLPDKG